MLIVWPGVLDDEFPGFDALAIDFDRPWLTATGYREFGNPYDEPQGPVGRYVKKRVAEARKRFAGGRTVERPLEEIVENIYSEDDPPGPPEDEPAWRPGGWIYEYRRKNPLPEAS